VVPTIPPPPDCQRCGRRGSKKVVSVPMVTSFEKASAMRACLALSVTSKAVSFIPSGSSNPLLLELVEGLLGHDLYDPAQHVRRVAVIPHRAGVIREREFRDAVHEVGVRRSSENSLVSRYCFLTQRVAEMPVVEAGRVRSRSCTVIGRRGATSSSVGLPSAAGLLDADLDLGELRQVLRHRIAERELALLHQHQ